MSEKFCYKQKKNYWIYPSSSALMTEKWALDVIKESLEQWFLIPTAYLTYLGNSLNIPMSGMYLGILIALVWA